MRNNAMTRNQSFTAAALAIVAIIVGVVVWNTYSTTTAPTSQPGIDAIDDALRQIPEDSTNP